MNFREMRLNQRISAAARATRDVIPGYFERCLEQRQPADGGAGSRFIRSVSEDDLLGAEWVEYAHPAIMAGCTAFRAPIHGRLGIIRLSDLDPQAEVVLDDRKLTGRDTQASHKVAERSFVPGT